MELIDFNQTITIENCVLGAVLIFGGSIDLIFEDLQPDCFLLKENADIYLAMQALKKQNIPIDFITVSNELKSQRTYKEIGASYIANLTNNVFTSANIEHHSRILLQRYVGRELEKIGRNKSKDPLENFISAKRKIEELENKIGKKTNTQHVSTALQISIQEMQERILSIATENSGDSDE